MLSVGWSSWASREKLLLTGDVSLFDLGVGVDELSSCFKRAFCVCVSAGAIDTELTESVFPALVICSEDKDVGNSETDGAVPEVA